MGLLCGQELAGNQIAELDEHVLAGLRCVRELDLSGNALAALGDGLAAMPALATLALEHNRLEALPDSLGACAALARLDVSHNQLRQLPACSLFSFVLSTVQISSDGIS